MGEVIEMARKKICGGKREVDGRCNEKDCVLAFLFTDEVLFACFDYFKS